MLVKDASLSIMFTYVYILHFVTPLICYRFLMCCEIRYNLRKMAAGQDHALFSVKTSPF